MILVVESNFVLELAFQREEVGHAEHILDLASKGEIDLAVPACALFEPFETLIRRRNARTQTLRSFCEQVRELGRSALFADLNQASEGVTRVMTSSVEMEALALDDTIRRLLDCADIIPLADEILGSSFGARNQFALQPQDSIIFASVDWYLNKNAKRESIFANRNSNDFAEPEVKAHFDALNCKVLSTFSDAVGRIQHRAKAH